MDTSMFAGMTNTTFSKILIIDFNSISWLFSDARNMAREVRDIILETIVTEGKKSKQEAETYLKRMESQRRYSADVWS